MRINNGGTATIPSTQATDVEVAAAVTTHEGLADPHSGYRLESADHSHASTGLQGGTLAYAALAAGGAGTAWTPVVSQSGTVTSFLLNTCTYIQIGKQVFAKGRITVNNAGGVVAANGITVTLPVNARNGTDVLGFAKLFDASAVLLYTGMCVLAAANAFNIIPADSASFDPTTTSTLGNKNFVAALATNDIIDFFVEYEAA